MKLEGIRQWVLKCCVFSFVKKAGKYFLKEKIFP